MIFAIMVISVIFFVATLLIYLRYHSKLKQIYARQEELIAENSRLQAERETLIESQNALSILQKTHISLQEECKVLRKEIELEKQFAQEKIHLLELTEQKFAQMLKTVGHEALESNSKVFLNMAQSFVTQIKQQNEHTQQNHIHSISAIVAPVQETLQAVQNRLSDIEQKRAEMFGSISQQMKELSQINHTLTNETHNLANALKNPQARGRWGEIQLRRVVELAGMLKYCDFLEQVSLPNEQKMLRPDMIVHLPNKTQIIIDAKAPLSAYLKSIESNEQQEQKQYLQEHAKNIRNHTKLLSSKMYWQQFPTGPEFVIMFMPGEVFFSTALEHDPELIEFTMQNNVIIATPPTLLAILHAINIGWRNENITQNARQIILLAQEMNKRLTGLVEHFNKIGRHLSNCVNTYNDAMNSFEKRMLVTMRKFDNNIPMIKQIQERTHQINSIQTDQE